MAFHDEGDLPHMTQTSQDSAQEYRRRISKALVYIRDNLDKRLSLSEVASEACFSQYHFHRLFSALMHETPGEYITRKKLERAAVKLAYTPGLKVTQIAEEFGYASVSSFSKAFNEWFGCRPTELKTIKSRLDSVTGKLQERYDKSIEADQLFVDADNIEARFVELDCHTTIGDRRQTTLSYLTSQGGYNFASIWSTGQELTERVKRAGVSWSACQQFAISHDHPGLTAPEHCRYDACVQLPEDQAIDLGLPTTTIPAGRYAIFPAEGPDHAILGQYLEFYTIWMTQSGYEPDNFPVVERYLSCTETGYLHTELLTKLTPLRPA